MVMQYAEISATQLLRQVGLSITSGMKNTSVDVLHSQCNKHCVLFGRDCLANMEVTYTFS